MAALAAGFPRLRPKFPPRIYSGARVQTELHYLWIMLVQYGRKMTRPLHLAPFRATGRWLPNRGCRRPRLAAPWRRAMRAGGRERYFPHFDGVSPGLRASAAAADPCPRGLSLDRPEPRPGKGCGASKAASRARRPCPGDQDAALKAALRCGVAAACFLPDMHQRPGFVRMATIRAGQVRLQRRWPDKKQ